MQNGPRATDRHPPRPSCAPSCSAAADRGTLRWASCLPRPWLRAPSRPRLRSDKASVTAGRAKRSGARWRIAWRADLQPGRTPAPAHTPQSATTPTQLTGTPRRDCAHCQQCRLARLPLLVRQAHGRPLLHLRIERRLLRPLGLGSLGLDCRALLVLVLGGLTQEGVDLVPGRLCGWAAGSAGVVSVCLRRARARLRRWEGQRRGGDGPSSSSSSRPRIAIFLSCTLVRRN